MFTQLDRLEHLRMRPFWDRDRRPPEQSGQIGGGSSPILRRSGEFSISSVTNSDGYTGSVTR